MNITIYQLVLMAKENAEERQDIESTVYFQAMLNNLTVEEAEQPAAYFGVMV